MSQQFSRVAQIQYHYMTEKSALLAHLSLLPLTCLGLHNAGACLLPEILFLLAWAKPKNDFFCLFSCSVLLASLISFAFSLPV